MIFQFRSARRLALVVGLCFVGSAAQAEAISYATVGNVGAPASGPGGLVSYKGVDNGLLTGNGSIDLGQFVVSKNAASTNATFSNTAFNIIASSGQDRSAKIGGVINGSVGPNATDPSLALTVTSVEQYGTNPLPFVLSLPLHVPISLAMTDGATDSATILSGPALISNGSIDPAAVPEPSSIAIFAVALGGLAFHRRRAARRAA